MLRNFLGTIGRPRTQRSALRNGSEPEPLNSPMIAKASPAFDQWLQAYRKRLEEACQRTNSGRVSHANANG